MEMLTKLQELLLLSVWRLKENAYGTTIFRHIQAVTEKKLSLGGVYFPLDRLTKQGYLRAYYGSATEERKGLSKRYYELTEMGLQALQRLQAGPRHHVVGIRRPGRVQAGMAPPGAPDAGIPPLTHP